MKIVVISDDVVINFGVINFLEKTLYHAENLSELKSNDFEFELFCSYDDFIRTYNNANGLDEIVLLFYFFRLNSIDSNLFMQCLDKKMFVFPIIIYTSDYLKNEYLNYLYMNNVFRIITPHEKEDKISEAFFGAISKSMDTELLDRIDINRNKKNEKVLSLNNKPVHLAFKKSYVYGSNPKLDISSTQNGYYSTLNIEKKESSVVSRNAHINSLDLSKLDLSLSTRKQKLINGLILGLNNKDLAERSNLSLGTVRNYIHQLSNHFEVSNRTELALKLRKILEI